MRIFDIKIIRIVVSIKDLVDILVGDSIIGVFGDIIQEFIYCFVGGFSGGGLLMSKFAECD